jgi:hypothetical protein
LPFGEIVINTVLKKNFSLQVNFPFNRDKESHLRLRSPHGKLVAPPFCSFEKGGGKMQTVMTFLSPAFLYNNWRCEDHTSQMQAREKPFAVYLFCMISMGGGQYSLLIFLPGFHRDLFTI